VLKVVAVLGGLALLAGCADGVPMGGGSAAREWLPRLEQENAFVCHQDFCHTAERGRAGG